jgi:hypothetical protein
MSFISKASSLSLFILLNIYRAVILHSQMFRCLFHREKLSSKLIKMMNIGLSCSRMYPMIILFIFQFQIATNLIKYSVQFFLC